jgi:hypothetical protein
VEGDRSPYGHALLSQELNRRLASQAPIKERPVKPAITADAIRNFGKQAEPATFGHKGNDHHSGTCGGRPGEQQRAGCPRERQFDLRGDSRELGYRRVPEPPPCAMALAGLACGGYARFCRHRSNPSRCHQKIVALAVGGGSIDRDQIENVRHPVIVQVALASDRDGPVPYLPAPLMHEIEHIDIAVAIHVAGAANDTWAKPSLARYDHSSGSKERPPGRACSPETDDS